MAETRAYVAIGIEAARGTAESTTVGFIPVNSFSLPKPDFMANKRQEFRGEDTAKGPVTERRMGQQWNGLSLEMPFYTESGSAKGLVGGIIKHFFGTATTAQNAATGQYAHMAYAIPNPHGTGATLEAVALTANMNAMHGDTIKNHPYTGGRVSKLSFKQEPAQSLLMTAELMGQKLDAIAAGIASPVFAAENLRADFNNMTVRAGATVTRTGSAPDYTNITSNGTVVTPDSLSLELDFGKEDRMILNGTDTVGKTSVKELTGKLSMTFDFEDPASGFSSVDEFTTWLAAQSETNFLITWDTGTQAGTGLNHQLIIDLPVCNRLGGMPEIARDGDPKITLEFDFHYSATTKYSAGVLLINTASAV
ncbi:hypothetical protein PLCT1_02347 [Planctomycetaceae bacterium]|nr:hypothetical protein PLCT1_02347 [Planctomycetaceae bacterium]